MWLVLRMVAVIDTVAGQARQGRFGRTITSEKSTAATRRRYTSRRIPPKFHHPPPGRPLGSVALGGMS